MDRPLSRAKRRQARRNSQRAIDQVARPWRDRADPALQALASHVLRSWQSLCDQPRRLRSLVLTKDWPWRLRLAGFAALSVLLLWLVAAKGYLANVETAAAALPSDPQAVDSKDYLSRAEIELHVQEADTPPPAAENTPKQIAEELGDQARRQAVGLLVEQPLNARVLRILGELADAAGDQANAAALMQAAARRSLQETRALAWLIANRFKQGDLDRTVYYTDALLRTRPQLVPQVTPVLAQIAENKDKNSVSLLENLLAGNPPWRRAFFRALPTSVSDVRTPLNLLLNLRETPTPPTAADLQAYINFLIAHKFYDVAYYVWLQFLPPRELSNVGYLYNANFETEPSGLPFDWVIRSGSGVTIDIVPLPEDQTQKALYIEFGYGRVNFRSVTQMVVLPPGTYQLHGKYKGEIMGRRGLLWRIACADGRRLGESNMFLGTKPEWQQFDFSFTVPNRDCPAQRVSLMLDSRSASEQFVTGSVWYDDLGISRDESGVITQSESR
jgi:hypothetical protein